MWLDLPEQREVVVLHPFNNWRNIRKRAAKRLVECGNIMLNHCLTFPLQHPISPNGPRKLSIGPNKLPFHQRRRPPSWRGQKLQLWQLQCLDMVRISFEYFQDMLTCTSQRKALEDLYMQAKYWNFWSRSLHDILGSRSYARAAPDKELWAPGKRPRFFFDKQINKQITVFRQFLRNLVKDTLGLVRQREATKDTRNAVKTRRKMQKTSNKEANKCVIISYS